MKPSRSEYDLTSVGVPVLKGAPLKLVAALLESPLRRPVAAVLARKFGLPRFRRMRFEEAPTVYPIHFSKEAATAAEHISGDQWPENPDNPGPGFRFATVHDYAAAYREGRTTPEEVAERVLEAIAASEAVDPPLRAFVSVIREDVLWQAREATERIHDGKALGVLDGVPVRLLDP